MNKNHKDFLYNDYPTLSDIFLSEYAKEGNLSRINELASSGSSLDWDYALWVACFYGRRDSVMLILQNYCVFNINLGLEGACRGRTEFAAQQAARSILYRDLAELMIEHGATHCFCKRSLEEHLE